MSTLKLASKQLLRTASKEICPILKKDTQTIFERVDITRQGASFWILVLFYKAFPNGRSTFFVVGSISNMYGKCETCWGHDVGRVLRKSDRCSMIFSRNMNGKCYSDIN